MDGALDVFRRIVGNSHPHPRRQLRLDAGHGVADPADHFQRVGGGKHPDAHEGGPLAVETDVLLVVLGAQGDIRDIAEPDDGSPVLLHHEATKLIRGLEVGVGHEVHRDHRPFRLPQRGEIVVLRQGVADLRCRDSHGRHPLGLEPDAHGERAAAQDVGALHALDRAQLGLNDPRQIVRDLVLIEILGRKSQVHRREAIVRGLQLDDRRLGFRWQVVPHLGHLRLDLRQCRVGVVVQLQVHRDGAHALSAGGLEVVDAVRARDHPLERRRDEAAHEIRVGAHVGGGHRDDRDVAAGILPHAERPDRLEPGDQDDETDHHGQHGPANEEIGEFHQLSSGFGAELFDGRILLLIRTEAPFLSLKTPEVTTSSPAVRPETTAT